jgi:ribosome-binding protein aMBF1 (putative translation factor)
MRAKILNQTLVRDLNTGAILETDIAKLNRHRAVRRAIDERESKIDDLAERINKLETIIERMTNDNTNA